MEARILDHRTAVITLTEPVPQGYASGDAVENADWQPAVVFRNNIARMICARSRSGLAVGRDASTIPNELMRRDVS